MMLKSGRGTRHCMKMWANRNGQLKGYLRRNLRLCGTKEAVGWCSIRMLHTGTSKMEVCSSAVLFYHLVTTYIQSIVGPSVFNDWNVTWED